MSRSTLIFLVGLAAWLAGCSGALAPPEATPFRPPTAVATLPAAPSPTAALPTPTPAPPACTDGMKFIEDMSVPDGSLVRPGTVLDKRWQVENNGTCNWDEGYRLKLVDGPEMGAQPEQALFPARSGVQAVIRVVFTAPSEPGRYRSAWQAIDPQGEPFGDLIFMEIVVEGP